MIIVVAPRKMFDLLDEMDDWSPVGTTLTYKNINSICYRLKKTDYPMPYLSEEEKTKMMTEALEGKTPCINCGKIGNFVNTVGNPLYPVIVHDHLIPNKILGISHNVCNLNRNYECVKEEKKEHVTECKKYDDEAVYWGDTLEEYGSSSKEDFLPKKKVKVDEKLHIPILFHNMKYDIQYVRQALAKRGCQEIKENLINCEI